MENNEFPHEIRQKLADIGLYGIIFPEEYGGQDASYMLLILALEEIAKILPGLAIHIQLQYVVGDEFKKYGTEEQKRRYLPPLISGEEIGCFGFTEPDTGSDPEMIQTKAVLEGDTYVLNGTKRFITNASIAQTMLVFAKEDGGDISLFVVPTDSEGFSTGPMEDKMGLRGTLLSDVFLDHVRIPKENLLGGHGGKFQELKDAMTLGKLCLCAQCLGIMEAALEHSLQYAATREQRGKPINKFLSIRGHIAEMASMIEASRWLLYRNGYLKDLGGDTIRDTAITKLFVSQITVDVLRRAVQIHGPYGICKQYKVEQLFRDGKMYELLEGTSEVQRELIARRVTGVHSSLID
jgi:alkylation response protein AidB-like acyl-CoA dehydrogenase